MFRILKILLFFALFLNANDINSKVENMTNGKENLKEIYLAGGCFWGMEGYFKRVKGVVESEVGYANGKSEKTDYYSLKNTDHAETLKVKFDENVVAFAEILEHFFRVIDPVSVDKQGNDVGRQYRTGIYASQLLPPQEIPQGNPGRHLRAALHIHDRHVRYGYTVPLSPRRRNQHGHPQLWRRGRRGQWQGDRRVGAD